VQSSFIFQLIMAIFIMLVILWSIAHASSAFHRLSFSWISASHFASDMRRILRWMQLKPKL
jgi:hypothetical protein